MERDLVSKDSLIPMYDADTEDSSVWSGADYSHNSRLRYTKWGIFEVAYEPSGFSVSRLPSFFPTRSSISSYREPLLAFLRLLGDMWRLSKWHCAEYYIFTASAVIAPAVSIYVAYLIFFNIQCTVSDCPMVKDDAPKEIQRLALAWSMCGLVSRQVDSMLLQFRIKIGGSLRSHFIPKLVKARLQWNHDECLQEESKNFPYASDYGDFIPAWEFFQDAFSRLCHTLEMFFQTVVVIYIISQQEIFQFPLLLGLTASLLIIIFTPSNAVGGAGYTFWTKNSDYNRLMVLFNIIFDNRYRPTAIKDGVDEYLCDEYRKASKSLGVVKADTWILGWDFCPPWHWKIAESWMQNSPMALYVLVLLFTGISSPSVIGSMALLQYVVLSMHSSISELKNGYEKRSFYDIMSRTQRFYEILDKPDTSKELMKSPAKSAHHMNPRGTKMTMKNVSYHYPAMDVSSGNAISNVDLNINPGEVIVIAGANGSGKTTLVKLLCGLIYPTEGEVWIDDKLVSNSDAKSIRQAAVFVGQSEAVYPLSLRENILMGLTTQSQRDKVTNDDLEEAARLGGSWNLLNRLGQDKTLQACSIVGYSIRERPGIAACDALNRNCPPPIPVPVSSGEQQRLIISRAFMRAKHTNAKFIILDEPSNALDTIAERDIFENFRDIARENGQTLIIVTHRLASVAKYADRIICMENGMVAEQGVHKEILKNRQTYFSLYNAQIITD